MYVHICSCFSFTPLQAIFVAHRHDVILKVTTKGTLLRFCFMAVLFLNGFIMVQCFVASELA